LWSGSTMSGSGSGGSGGSSGSSEPHCTGTCLWQWFEQWHGWFPVGQTCNPYIVNYCWCHTGPTGEGQDGEIREFPCGPAV
jgi:hypothetical protein